MFKTISQLLLSRGIMNVVPGNNRLTDRHLQAFDLELGLLGYAVSYKLRKVLATLSPEALAEQLTFVRDTLGEMLGAWQVHEPLFRSFPDGIPTADETFDLWVRKGLVHWCQSAHAPCLTCGRSGTTHVLWPCYHVVCEKCYDGTSYSACPICERDVDRSSPFFQPSTPRTPSAREQVTLKLIDLGEGFEVEAHKLFQSYCLRTQAMSPDDRANMKLIVTEIGLPVTGWLPKAIPIKENLAIVFGELLKDLDQVAVFQAARPYLATATDVLRVIAVYSGDDGSLQGKQELANAGRHRRKRQFRTVKRFKTGKLCREFRREVLGFLNELSFERLVEDMMRHESYWVWLGEFLHPFEYRTRYPQACMAFAVLRGTKPGQDGLGNVLRRFARSERLVTIASDGTFRAPTFNAQLEAAARIGDGERFVSVAEERPGDFARRLDQALCLVQASGQPQALEKVAASFLGRIQKMATPVLATLLGHLPSRRISCRNGGSLPHRIFWPKGQVAKGVSIADERDPLPDAIVNSLVNGITNDLLRRFGEKPGFVNAVIDPSMRGVIVPFNERTASPGQVATLPRGSQLAVPEGKTMRLFVHWCQTKGGERTDLDLSAAFYNASWDMVGHCSWQGLSWGKIKHSGDRQEAPFPKGNDEYIDLDVDAARRYGARYAVMQVLSFCGQSFDELERAYAGVMMRDDVHGQVYDPRTVEFKFSLKGESGVFVPMVVDLETGMMHWVDLYKSGRSSFNTVHSEDGDSLPQVCREMMEYFGSGVRISMLQLALLHAAARCKFVCLRNEDGFTCDMYTRYTGESVPSFYGRLVRGECNSAAMPLPQQFEGATFACLLKGDMKLPEGSQAYALHREQLTSVIAAADLLS